MGGGAWPFLVGEVICLVNSDNERDLPGVLVRAESAGAEPPTRHVECREAGGNNRSVMPLDVLGCTRATLTEAASNVAGAEALANLVKLCRAGDRPCNYRSSTRNS